MLVPRSAFSLHEACDRDAIRYALSGVLFRRAPDGRPEAVATDGYRLLSCRWNEPDPGEYPKMDGCDPVPNGGTFSAVIPKANCQRAPKLPGSRKSVKPILRYVAVDEHAEDKKPIPIAATDLERTECMLAKPVEGRYPKVEDVWSGPAKYQKSGKPTFGIVLDPTLLANTLKTMVKAAGGQTEDLDVVLTIAGGVDDDGIQDAHSTPLLLTMRGAENDVAGIIMPVSAGKGSVKVAEPGWFPTD